ncbi:hypothetical protein D6850_07800 [Roseovarius spongiae]|uniref:Uncharacterized protein n=1 Tax=Roseovarius spongiae TaxID=2320272 RepID=A0A3A8ATB2_9RHOB|nr:hypothetical protein [Roseovarius spongiae]RKF14774.1 hypothetical protein D6850_07800 [Roseovarius spongiae]
MTALPHTVTPEGPLRRETPIPSHYIEDADDAMSPLRVGVYRGTAVAATIAALGLWMVPIHQVDPIMQIFKLFLSASLLLGAAALMITQRQPAGPAIEIDPRRRTLTVIDVDADGRSNVRAEHAIDSLSEIVLRDSLLTARDASGNSLIALPVNDAATHAALAQLLGQETR